MASSKRVVVAGGGPAAVELLLAMRALSGDATELALIAPEPDFVVRAYEVLTPFHEGRERHFPLTHLAADLNVELIRDELSSVDADARVVAMRSGAERGYDGLVIAVGARMRDSVKGTIRFQGSRDAARLKELLIESHAGRHRSVAFIVPGGQAWPLPIYELALQTSAWLSERDVYGVPLSLVSPEATPLASFGAQVSEEVASLLSAHGVSFVRAHAVRHAEDRLLLSGGRELEVEVAIALPRLAGPAIEGLPHDEEGFLPVDAFGRVTGVPGVFAAGDATNFPMKQGGLATQQADAIAELLAREVKGVQEPVPAPVPVLRAVLYTGREKRYLRAQLGDRLQSSSQASSSPLWPESSKVVGRYLAGYLDALEEARVAR